MNIKQKWKDAIIDPSSNLSVTNTTGEKLSFKENMARKLSHAMEVVWIGLTLMTISTAALTYNEWSNRMDAIKQGIQNGSIDTTKEAVDSQFFASRGANFKDSFLAVADNFIPSDSKEISQKDIDNNKTLQSIFKGMNEVYVKKFVAENYDPVTAERVKMEMERDSDITTTVDMPQIPEKEFVLEEDNSISKNRLSIPTKESLSSKLQSRNTEKLNIINHDNVKKAKM